MNEIETRRAAAEPMEWRVAQAELAAARERIGQLEGALARAGVVIPAPSAQIEAHLEAAKAATK